jgi:hypothetical protein
MEVKGTAVRPTPLFVRQRFKDRFDEWLDGLSEISRKIMSDKISTEAWYDLDQAMIEPTRKICDLFFGGASKGAWEVGRFSADYSLWGLYRLFVKIGSPLHLIEKATQVFSTYYRPSRMEISERGRNHAVARILEFSEPNLLVEMRIGGWIERALEISGCTDVQSDITHSLARGDPYTQFISEWR